MAVAGEAPAIEGGMITLAEFNILGIPTPQGSRKPLSEWQAATTHPDLPLHIRRNITEGEDGCWLWTRSLGRDGYGWASLDDRTHQAHRLVFQLVNGPITEGLILDHLCRVRHCVNPAHLEPVTPAENLRRSELTPAGMKRCRRGHELSPWYGQRRCVICKDAYDRKYRSQS